MLEAIRTLQDAGVEPDVWKIEGLDRREDCERLVETARRGGRDDVGCIVLGHGADENNVAGWLETAASVPGFIGFAVGRTTFWDAVADYESNKASRQEAVARVAHRYGHWATIFQRAHAVAEIGGQVIAVNRQAHIRLGRWVDGVDRLGATVRGGCDGRQGRRGERCAVGGGGC